MNNQNFKVHAIPHHNPLTGSNLNVDTPLGSDLSKKTFKFRKGYNLHAFYAGWGQIDQLCLRKQRYLRLMTLSNMVRQDEKSNEMGRREVSDECRRRLTDAHCPRQRPSKGQCPTKGRAAKCPRPRLPRELTAMGLPARRVTRIWPLRRVALTTTEPGGALGS